MKITSLLFWGAMLSCGSAFAAANGAMDAGAYIITVARGSDVTLSGDDVTTLLGTSADLVKRGEGRLVINTDLKTAKYAGEIHVEAGYLRVKAVGALGTTAKGTIIEDGATLEIDGSTVGANKSGFVEGEPLTITGNGMKEGDTYMGVVRNLSNDQYPGLCPVTMLGNCLYTTAKANSYRFDFRSGTVNMNGYTLTTRGYFALTLATIVNPGRIVVEEGVFNIENRTALNGGAANTFTLAAGATLYLQGARTALPWKLVLNNGSKVQAVSTGTDPSYNTWSGPVELVSGMANLQSDYRYSPLKFTGDISGAGGIKATGTSGAELCLLGTSNTFTGGLEVSGSGSIVFASNPGALPQGESAGPVKLSGQAALLGIYVGDDGGTEGAWTPEQYKELFAQAQVTGSGASIVMWNDAGQTKTFDEDVTTDVGIGHGGAGTLALTGAWQTGDLSNLGGLITVPSGKETHVRFLDLAGGTLRIPSGGLVYSHTNAYMGAKWPDIAKIEVQSGGCYMTSNAAPTGVYPMTMGRTRSANSANYRAILDVQGGGCITGRICVGTSQGSKDAAALYLRPGAYFRSWGTGGSCDMYVGSGGSGYVEIDSDAYLPGWTIVGSSAAGRAVWVQKGGSVQMAGDAFSIGASTGQGEAYFSGGSFTNNNEIHIGKSTWAYGGKGSRAVLTVAPGGRVVTKQAVDLAMQTNCLAALNLNGGVLKAKYIQKVTNTLQQVSSSGRKDMAFTDNAGFVNFNGGTFEAYQNGELFSSAPDRVNVFAGGATFDTAGFDCTVGVPLEAPSGKGLASIPLPPSCSVPWNYIGSPIVTIDGDGTNAWAHAIFDSTQGVVTGIEVVSPGTDYTWAKATVAYGGWTNQVVLDELPLVSNVSGGLTKKGNGMLTLLATNTFQGTVTVAGGRLLAGNDRAFPASAFDLAITGGTLDGGGHEWIFGAISATSGSVANVASSSAAASLTKTGEGTFDLDSPISIEGEIRVEGGTLVLPQAGPGLWEGSRTYPTNTPRSAEYALAPVFRDRVSTTLDFLYTNGVSATSLWKDQMNVSYFGYIWNTSEEAKTWCFGGVLDDGITLVIDGTTVLSAAGWTTPKFGKITVAPGPHSFHVLAYNGTGGAGATGCGTYYDWPAKHGLVWNPDGAFNEDGTASTNFYDYVDITDSARGAVFSLTADGYTSETTVRPYPNVAVAAGATLNVGSGTYAFESFRGLGNIQGSTSIRQWIIDGEEVAAGAQMHVTGDLAFPEGATFEFTNTSALPTSGQQLTIGTVDGTVTGRLPSVKVPNMGVWSVYASGKNLKLGMMKGTLLLFR